MRGYIQEQRLTDWVYRNYGGALNPTGQWKDYCPDMETQVFEWDTWGCVTFSSLNCLEILHNYQFGLGKYNFSDRFIGVLSGTIPGGGNSVQAVADTIRKCGLVKESDCPYVPRNEYYTIDNETKDKGKAWLNDWAVNYKSVRPEHGTYTEDIMQALQNGPLAVGVGYANGATDDEILNPTSFQNHFVTLVGYEKGKYWLIMDSYSRQFKRYAWGYHFAGIFLYSLTNKNENMFNLRQDQIYLLVEGPEQKAGLANDGHLMIGEKIDVLLNAVSRNGGFEKTDIIPLSLVDWNSVPHTDLKGNRI